MSEQIGWPVERIEWIKVGMGNRLPDADATVLIYAPTASEPIWLGYYCDEDGWHTIDHDVFGLGQVTHWAPMPRGPR